MRELDIGEFDDVNGGFPLLLAGKVAGYVAVVVWSGAAAYLSGEMIGKDIMAIKNS